jgi:hypothetical protein
MSTLLNIDFSQLLCFKNLDFNNIVSWDEIQLHCDLCGVEINHNFLMILLLMAKCNNNVKSVLCELIKREHFCDECLNSVIFTKNLYIINGNINSIATIECEKLTIYWNKIFNNNQRFFPLTIKTTFELETLLDNRFPLLWLKVYEQYKQVLSLNNNREFYNWLYLRLHLKSEYKTHDYYLIIILVYIVHKTSIIIK